jgi:hypothetical protein
MVVVPDEHGYADKGQQEFYGYDEDVLHDG